MKITTILSLFLGLWVSLSQATNPDDTPNLRRRQLKKGDIRRGAKKYIESKNIDMYAIGAEFKYYLDNREANNYATDVRVMLWGKVFGVNLDEHGYRGLTVGDSKGPRDLYNLSGRKSGTYELKIEKRGSRVYGVVKVSLPTIPCGPGCMDAWAGAKSNTYTQTMEVDITAA